MRRLFLSLAVVVSACAPRSGTTRLASAENVGQPPRAEEPAKPSAPPKASKPPPHPFTSRYVSNYVRTNVEHLTGGQRADLFERLPIEAFVYANADLDERSAKEVRESYLEHPFPRDGEPFVLLRMSKSADCQDCPIVTTADGVEVAVEWARLADSSTTTPAVARAPRALRSLPEAAERKASALQNPSTDLGWVSQALHPVTVALGREISADEFWQTKERIRSAVRGAADTMESCHDRVAAKFAPQVRAGTWTSQAPSGRTITVTSPRARQAEEKAAEQADKTCGDRAALQKKLAAFYDAEDARIRARIASERARNFERATARFRSAP